MTSQIKTMLLLAVLSAMIIFLGGAMGGRAGLMLALGLALIMNVGSYWFSDRIVLRMYRARELTLAEAPALHGMVEDLAHAAGVPKPRVCLIPSESPNAFATGRDPAHAVVAVTQGILRLLSSDELRGVLAHEMGHIANRDILIQTVAGVMASVIMYLASMFRWAAFLGVGRGDDSDGEGGGSPLAALALAIVAPIAAMLVQMAISRSREFLADETGAKLSRAPRALASALEKLSAVSERVPMRTGSEATAHLFIVTPFTASRIFNLFSTHPPMEERVARLRRMTV